MKKNLLTIAMLLASSMAQAAITPLQPSENAEISTNLFNNTMNPEAAKGIDGAVFYNVLGRVDINPELYAVEKGGDYIFTNKNGDMVITGELYDLKNETSITEQATKLVAKPILAGITPDDVVVYKSSTEETSNIVYVFSDPTCHYCVKLHDEFEALNAKGVEVRVVPFVRSLEHRLAEDTTLKNIEIMGMSDHESRLEAYKKLIHDKDVKHNSDDLTEEGFNRIKDGYSKGKKIGLKGTPMIITPDGDSIQGYAPADRIMDLLSKK